MNASSKNSAADTVSHTKSAFDDERYSTLPNPSGVKEPSTLPQGSVMWDGPSPPGEGTAPVYQGTSPSFNAETVTNSATAVREVNLGVGSATPDTKHKSAQITNAQPSLASSKPSLCDTVSANDAVFELETNASARTKNILAQIETTPAGVRPYLRSLHQLVQETKARHAQPHVSKPPALPPLYSMEEVQDLLTEAQALLDDLKSQRTHRKDTEASAQTLAGYQKDCALLDGVRGELLEETQWPWLEVLMQFVARKSTFYTYRAALTWRAKQELQGLLDARQSLSANLGEGAGSALMPQINQAVKELRSLRHLTYAFCSGWEDIPVKSPRSKRYALEYLDEYWPTRFIEQCYSSATYRNACVLLRFCGMRPEELELGVQVQRDRQMVAVKIQGAKVRETAGQPWRKFLLHAEHLPTWFVNDLPTHDSVEFKVNKDNFRTYLNGLTDRVLQGAALPDGSKINLSAYLFRHQIATDLRVNGWSSTEIASLLGEVSAETTKHYGNRWPGSRKHKPVVAADKNSLSTARPVQPASHEKIEEAQKAKKKKQSANHKQKRR